MTKRTRYSIILAGFIFFAIAAPLIVLYVRGISYDFKNNTFVKTGILAVRSDPGDAEIFLDGRLDRKGSGDIKFILPGEYEVTLKKPGYSDWNKRLSVKEGQVAWASPSFSNIYLFKKSPPALDLGAGILDLYAEGNNFIYLDKNNLTASSVNNPGAKKTYPLPKEVNQVIAGDQSGNNFALTNTESTSSAQTLLIFNKSSGKFFDIGNEFQSLPEIQFGQNGQIYALSDNTLYSVDAQSRGLNILFSGVKTFYAQEGALYFVQQKNQNIALYVSQTPFTASQNLADALPEFNSGKLFVTFEKEVFLLADGKLLLSGSGTQQLADNISNFNFDPNDSFLSIIHSGEFDYYDPLGTGLNFVTRSSEPLSNPIIKASLSNAFFLQNNKLEVIELDNRDTQNQYQLYSGADVQKFFVDDSGKNVLLLDSGALKIVNIR